MIKHNFYFNNKIRNNDNLLLICIFILLFVICFYSWINMYIDFEI